MRKIIVIAVNDGAVDGLIQERCSRWGRLHAIRIVKSLDKLLLELCEGDVDALLVDLDSIESREDLLINELSVINLKLPMVFLSGQESSLLQAAVVNAKSRGLNVVSSTSKMELGKYLDSRSSIFNLNQMDFQEQELEQDGEPAISKDVLRQAMHNNEITAYFQPLHYVNNGDVRGAEALARWKMAEENPICPAFFLKHISRHDLMEEFTSHILHQSLDFMRKAPIASDFVCGINVPASVATSWSWITSSIAEIQQMGISPENIVFEITEDEGEGNNEFLGGAVAHLRMKGFHCAIDDFGVGGSTASRMLSVPFDEVKIDRGVLHAARSQISAKNLLRKTISVARDIKALVVVEGVESNHDLSMIDSIHADIGQGLFYSPAVPAENFLEYMKGSR